ncbi:hypothetical protein [Propionivibrio sp.]|uniref:hypothetical protein n=1 Tax=Propionivibrio sp. TaxID=2212460 RepID=UPI003BF1DAD0
MKNHLKIVSVNPNSVSSTRLNGCALHQLADRLIEEIKAGHSRNAHILASLQNLSPFAIAVVATWMTKAGLSEADILNTVV